MYNSGKVPPTCRILFFYALAEHKSRQVCRHPTDDDDRPTDSNPSYLPSLASFQLDRVRVYCTVTALCPYLPGLHAPWQWGVTALCRADAGSCVFRRNHTEWTYGKASRARRANVLTQSDCFFFPHSWTIKGKVPSERESLLDGQARSVMGSGTCCLARELHDGLSYWVCLTFYLAMKMGNLRALSDSSLENRAPNVRKFDIFPH